MEPAERHYDDRESARIIARALEIQQREQAGGAKRAGLSLSELEGVARESGIDPTLVRRAAMEVAGEPAAAVGRFARVVFGNPVRVVSSLVIPHRVEREALQTLATTLASITGDTGNGSVVGDALVWNSDALVAMRSGRGLAITIRPVHGATHVRVESNLSGVAGGLFGGITGGVGLGAGLGIGLGVGLGALGSTLFAALVPFGFLASAWLLSRGIYALVARYRRNRDAHTLETIGSMLGGEGSEAR